MFNNCKELWSQSAFFRSSIVMFLVGGLVIFLASGGSAPASQPPASQGGAAAPAAQPVTQSQSPFQQSPFQQQQQSPNVVQALANTAQNTSSIARKVLGAP